MTAMLKDSVDLLPPNYQREEKFQFSTGPRIYDQLLYLDYYKTDDKVYGILGSSKIAGTYWEGTLFYYDDVDKLGEYNKSLKRYSHTSSTDGKFLNENTIALAEDTGNLKILRDDYTSEILQVVVSFPNAEHIRELAVWQNEKKVIAVCGRTVSIWNVESNERLFRNDDVHMNTINSVDSTSDPCVFVTASSDKISCLWDTRCQIPTVLYSNNFSGLTKIRRNKQNPNYFAIGTRAGEVYLIDKRKSPDFVTLHECFKAPIQCLAFESDEQLAVAAGYDNGTVKVFDTKDQEIVELYNSDAHKSAVKGLAWFNNTLFSCGFEKQLVKHKI